MKSRYKNVEKYIYFKARNHGKSQGIRDVREQPQAVNRRCSVKKVFSKISRDSQENTCPKVSFLMKVLANGYQSITKGEMV